MTRPCQKNLRWISIAVFVMVAMAGLVILPCKVTAQEPSAQPIPNTANLNLDQQLKDIVSVNFNGATIEEATTALALKSKELDPHHRGVQFIIDPTASKSARPITLSLENVPLREILRYVCQLAGVKFKVDDYAISIIPFSESTDELISRTFIVSPGFVAPPQGSTTNTAPLQP